MTSEAGEWKSTGVTDEGGTSDLSQKEVEDARFGLDLIADGAWKVMLGLEVLRDHVNLFPGAQAHLEQTEYWIRKFNEELDTLYDRLPDSLSEDNSLS